MSSVKIGAAKRRVQARVLSATRAGIRTGPAFEMTPDKFAQLDRRMKKVIEKHRHQKNAWQT